MLIAPLASAARNGPKSCAPGLTYRSKRNPVLARVAGEASPAWPTRPTPAPPLAAAGGATAISAWNHRSRGRPRHQRSSRRRPPRPRRRAARQPRGAAAHVLLEFDRDHRAHAPRRRHRRRWPPGAHAA